MGVDWIISFSWPRMPLLVQFAVPLKHLSFICRALELWKLTAKAWHERSVKLDSRCNKTVH